MRQRVQRLIDAGVMQIVAVTDPMHSASPGGDDRYPLPGRRHQGGRTARPIDSVDYVVLTAGTFDAIVEVVCDDDAELLDLLNTEIRVVPGVRLHRDAGLSETR